jgi:hypothetical protein
LFCILFVASFGGEDNGLLKKSSEEDDMFTSIIEGKG